MTTHENERDTKFRGFAKLLMLNLGLDLSNDFTRQIIAQRAYDLVRHSLDNTPNYIHYDIADIPDMTELP